MSLFWLNIIGVNNGLNNDKSVLKEGELSLVACVSDIKSVCYWAEIDLFLKKLLRLSFSHFVFRVTFSCIFFLLFTPTYMSATNRSIHIIFNL